MGQVADGGAFGGAHPLDLFLGVQVDISPRHYRIGRDDLNRFVEFLAEAGHQVRMAVDHGVHRIAQPRGSSGPVTVMVELHRIQITEILVRCSRERAVPVAAGSAVARRRSGGAACSSSIWCWLSRAGAMSEGVSPPPPVRTWAQMPARASNHSRLSRLIWRLIQYRRRPHPVGVQLRSRVGVDGAGVELDGVHQRHRHRGGGVGDRQTVLADPPRVIGHLGGGAEASEVVEPDRRVRSGQVDIGVQVPQQTVGHAVGQGSQLLPWRP